MDDSGYAGTAGRSFHCWPCRFKDRQADNEADLLMFEGMPRQIDSRKGFTRFRVKRMMVMVEWILENKSISTGAGVAVLTALGQVFSESVKQHPHYAIASGIFAALMIIIPLLPLRGKVTLSPIGHERANKAGRDNNGKQLIAETIHYHESFQPVPIATTSSKKPTANLIALPPSFITSTEFMLPETPAHQNICVLPIRNVIPLGGVSCAADSVCGSIDFLWNGVKLGSADRAFWNDEPGNEITIEPQTIKRLVLGRYDNGLWSYYNNPQQFRPQWQGPEGKDAEVFKISLGPGNLLMEVTIFNRWKGYQYLQEIYSITPIDDGGGVEIKRVVKDQHP